MMATASLLSLRKIDRRPTFSSIQRPGRLLVLTAPMRMTTINP
jgi:hypothetical protein